MQLRPTTIADLETLYTFQLDDEAAYIAAFVSEDRADKAAYIAKWTKHLASDKAISYTITIDDQVTGSVGSYEMEGEWQITYWLDKQFWGRGIATAAAKEFLKLFPTRPLYGRAAFDNIASIKVMQNCGFVHVGNDMYYAHARGKEIEEVIYKLA